MLQDIDSVDMDDYKYNYVNLTGFRIVDPGDEFTYDIIQQMFNYEQNSNRPLMKKQNSRIIPVSIYCTIEQITLQLKKCLTTYKVFGHTC